MADDATREMLSRALERLQAEMQAYLATAGISSHSPVRDTILRALSDMRSRLEDDPTWADDMLRPLTAAPTTPRADPATSPSHPAGVDGRMKPPQ